MAFGLPYDSDAGRDFAATLTAILCGDAYWQSAAHRRTCPPLGVATPLTAAGRQRRRRLPRLLRQPRALPRRHPHAPRRGQQHRQARRTRAEPFVVPQLDAAHRRQPRLPGTAPSPTARSYGYRNSQVTVLAPTGTIGFMMDCDTTGIEPDLALVKYKKLVGGGMIKIVNNTVPAALFKLGYNDAEVNAIVSYIDATGTIEGAPGIKPEHLAVFDCSFKPAKGTRSIHYMGHIKMMAATQPFLSGAISKTVNLPQDCSVDDIAEAYIESLAPGPQGRRHLPRQLQGHPAAQRLRRKTDADKKRQRMLDADRAPSRPRQHRSRAARRRGRPSRRCSSPRQGRGHRQAGARTPRSFQPRSTTQLKAIAAAVTAERRLPRQAQAPPRAVRHRLPAERASITHKFGLAGHEGYITVGLYPNGQPGEIFIRMAKEGSTVSGLMDSFATAVSLALQHGVPLKVLCEKFAHTRFEPSGWTGNEQIGYAKSIMDYIFRWIQLRFLSGHQLDLFAGLAPSAPQLPAVANHPRSRRGGRRAGIVKGRTCPSSAEEVSQALERSKRPSPAGQTA